ncbi:fumarate hydratase [candidate division MSBL1 archaeon SCGC-AAA259E22]|uniref:Fumarate hydratase n=1 Tax=candidate division MSBL1 archaeon SCGC-AAA259E22 TaxID=1698265 RepID=A0A133UI10_9EURY|nr:fumarate hydratase [candidate division MSBL1 archaeon SCGC-AAA259E22]
MDLDLLEEKLVSSIGKSVTSISQPTLDALKKAKEKEEGSARVQLEAMLEAVEVGERDKVPVCQDTGIPTFFIKIGKSFPQIDEITELESVLEDAVERATEEVPLRPNTVHPITEQNPGNNIGKHIPYIEWSFCEGDDVDIFYLPKGGGSENMCQLNMMTPGKGLQGVKEIVLERIASMGGKPCPPAVIGVGLGGGSNIAMNLAKEAILRPVGKTHEEEISKLETELREKANELGVGPMGVGGKTTVLDVHIKYAHRHPASYPVGIVVQCWANRRGHVTINSNGSVEVVY